MLKSSRVDWRKKASRRKLRGRVLRGAIAAPTFLLGQAVWSWWSEASILDNVTQMEIQDCTRIMQNELEVEGSVATTALCPPLSTSIDNHPFVVGFSIEGARISSDGLKLIFDVNKPLSFYVTTVTIRSNFYFSENYSRNASPAKQNEDFISSVMEEMWSVGWTRFKQNWRYMVYQNYLQSFSAALGYALEPADINARKIILERPMAKSPRPSWPQRAPG